MTDTGAMPAILVVAHGKLASELVASVAMIAGDAEDVVPISLAPGERPEDLCASVVVRAEGEDAETAVAALRELVDSRFGEPE
jgi:mannose/fructose-specific phosphotransferase system component IIA